MGLYPLGTGLSLDRNLIDLAVPEFEHIDYNIPTLGVNALPRQYQPIPIHQNDPNAFLRMDLSSENSKKVMERN